MLPNGTLPSPVPLQEEEEFIEELIIPPPPAFQGGDQRSSTTFIGEVEPHPHSPGRPPKEERRREVRSSDLFPPGFDFVDGGVGGYFSPSPELLPQSPSRSFPQHARWQVCVCLSTACSGSQAGRGGAGTASYVRENTLSFCWGCIYIYMF